jgi:hypothetical protein
MCRAALNRRRSAKLPACAPRHIGASWTTTLPRSPPALAPGNAPLALRNARLGQTPRWCASVPRPRAPTPKRATRHSGHAFRKLQAQPQSRFLDHHPPQPTRPALAPSNAPLALRNARLTQHPHRCTTLPRPQASAPKRATRPSGHALRKLQAQPQSRFVVHNRSGSRAALVRRALLRQGSAMPGFSPVLVCRWRWKSQRSACISQSAGALSPKTRLASPRAGGLAYALPSPPFRAPRPCAGSRSVVAS